MHAHLARRAGQGRRADEIKGGVGAAGYSPRPAGATSPMSSRGVVDAVLLQHGQAACPPGGGQHRGAAPGGQRGGGQAHRGGSAADQHGLAGLQVQADGERAFGYRRPEPDGGRMLPVKLTEWRIAGPDAGRLQREGQLVVDGRR